MVAKTEDLIIKRTVQVHGEGHYLMQVGGQVLVYWYCISSIILP